MARDVCLCYFYSCVCVLSTIKRKVYVYIHVDVWSSGFHATTTFRNAANRSKLKRKHRHISQLNQFDWLCWHVWKMHDEALDETRTSAQEIFSTDEEGEREEKLSANLFC